MRLSLMMRFVPGEHLDPIAVGPRLGLGGLLVDHARIDAAEVLDHVVALRGQVGADLVDRGNVVVGRAAAGETAHEFGVEWLAAGHSDVDVAVVGGGDVHELPGDVGPAGTGTKGENLLGVGPFGDGLDRPQRSAAAVFEKLDQVSEGHVVVSLWKRRRALAVVCAATVSSGRPSTSASLRAVQPTWVGSLRSPGTGTGARYGQSVSASTRSRGTVFAVARRSSAFLYVSMPAKEMNRPMSRQAAAIAASPQNECITALIGPRASNS